MYLEKDKYPRRTALFLVTLALFACGKRAKISESPSAVILSSFASQALLGAEFTPLAPNSGENLVAAGASFFSSDGEYSHHLSFSDASEENASGSYFIEKEGRMVVELGGSFQLPGAVNPAEDFLVLGDSSDSNNQHAGLIFSASPNSFPSDQFPNFTGTYTFIGVRFLFNGGLGFDLSQSTRTLHGKLTIIQNDFAGGPFVVQGADSSGATVNLTGEFAIGNDLSLLFTVDGLSNEVWTGSFAPSGILLLSDATLDNGDAGSFVAMSEDVGFAGIGPLVFEGEYLVLTLSFFSNSVTPFGTELAGAVRRFQTEGTFFDECDGEFLCLGESFGSSYTLTHNGELSIDDPFFAAPFLGAVSSDLGAFVAVELDASAGGLPQEASISIGIALLP